MASDLSTLIQEGLCNTLNGLLAKDAVLKETTKAVKEDMPSINLLKVESTFEFDNITSVWTFFIPAYTASYIFNTMLGDDSDPVLEIDEDIADAMNEFISNLSGGLTTAINGENFEDLGQSKFVVSGSEKLSSENVENFDNMYKFSIDLEGKNLFLFIQYDEIILPFLSVLSQSKESVHEDTVTVDEVENSGEVEEETLVEEPQAVTEEIESFELQNEEEETPKEEEEETQAPKENKKLKIIVIVIAALLILTLLSGIIMYFTGVFDEPEVQPEPVNTQKKIEPKNNVNVVQYEEKPDFNFKITDINKKRLNARLEALTKYDILNEEEIQAQNAAEKERLYQLEKEQELIEFAAKNKEEDIFTKKDLDPKREIEIRTKFSETKIEGEAPQTVAEETKTEIATAQNVEKQDSKKIDQTAAIAEEETKAETADKTIKTEEAEEKKIKFVLVQSLKYRLYNQLISQITTKDARISICSDKNGRAVVYIGPFSNEEEQNKMVTLIQDQNINDAVTADITQEEFDARCSFE
eukprot:Anaeramoba_ignava/a221010_676.p1 GENE.a221010_676~~a221010_676.p1  ORF type:complete len:526 (-),score=43.61 a221010_676:219-1796(-)